MQAKTRLAVGCGRRIRTPRHICGAYYRTMCLRIARDHLFTPCAYAFASSRRPDRRQRQRPAAYSRRLCRNFWLEQVQQPSCTMYATFCPRAYRAASCEALQARSARKSSVFGPSRPPCARYGPHDWPARRAQPHLDVFDGARPLHPVRVASGTRWPAPPET
jgi:hypothetical protein